jgi:hypothetical protein
MIVNLKPLTFSTFTDLRTENGGDMMSSGPKIVLALALLPSLTRAATFDGWITGSSSIPNGFNNGDFDLDNIASCEAAFGAGSTPASISDFVSGISGITNTDSWVIVGKGPGGEEVMTPTNEGGWVDAEGRYVSLKSNGWIRLGIRPNTNMNSIVEPVYSSDPMTICKVTPLGPLYPTP